MEDMKQDQESTITWKSDKVKAEYKEALSYHSQEGYVDTWKENTNFYNGQQWKAATEATKHMPRPVLNIVKYIINHKVSSILADQVKMIFTSQEIEEEQDPMIDPVSGMEIPVQKNPLIEQSEEGADKFSKYSSSLWENIEQDKLNEEMMFDGAILGTGILHYYWDNSVTGGVTSKWVGDIRGESLDPMNVFFANPQEREVQKQPWIIISSREREEDVRAVAEANEVPTEYIELIQADQEQAAEGYDTAQNELKSNKKLTVLTKYYKEGGIVYFTKVVDEVVIQPPTSTDLRLYPIVTFSYEPKKKSIHGNSEVEGLIANQKGINFLFAMMLYSSQNTAFPKLLSKPGAVKQLITNEPGEIIIDNSGMGAIDGIKYMATGNFSGQVLTLVQNLIEVTQRFAGAQDVSMGDTPGANMAASAIMMLQKSAGISTDGIRKRFYRSMEDVGRIWEEFWKKKYNVPRNVMVQDENGPTMDNFTGTEYGDLDYNLKIDVGAGGTYSESMAQATLDNLFNGGQIDLLTYLKYSSKTAMPFKDSLIKDIKQQQEEQAALMQGQQGMLDGMVQEQIGQFLGGGQAQPQQQQPQGAM